MERPNEAFCWQCGEAAEGDSAYVQMLNAPTKRRLDGQGYDVKRGRWQDTVKVRVPRCRGCRDRSRKAAVTMMVGVFVGFAVAWTAFPKVRWVLIVAPLLGYLIPLGAMVFDDKRSGRKSLGAYPPLKSLKAAGWAEPSAD